MKRHIHKDFSFRTYCGLEAPQRLECTPIRESHHVGSDLSLIADCKTCKKARIAEVKSELIKLAQELEVRETINEV